MPRRWIKKYSLLFIIGAVGYAAIEVIWRGRTHWSMIIAGGLCFVIFSLVAGWLQGRSILIKAVVCAIGVTAVEFIFGAEARRRRFLTGKFLFSRVLTISTPTAPVAPATATLKLFDIIVRTPKCLY